MPQFDGFYALENIRKWNNTIKIIVLTGLLTESSVKNLDQYEIFATLIKPVDPDEIIKKIKNT
jgi:DNA-binding NarL/FixJ family response regulator